ncbi:aminotransferase class I/II-fold pyridoxal phosphate-dependent enzyme [Chitiniphilus purpureus]|uniref:Putative 8-amino-7-oxononanoate synthase n=1 Tax=Chitiniphilus purpureus TaxID=2981137 RepID=A0ABY6DRZ2_9NEIS|nr:aminotransferase class I/II-fold pyridoxal phosphate-dependent enzyme [Chitiniphilus sp. CD1]UXY17131.1 aminotransferase class I/II-fold pyridoxal phosphate-dependent enzyme [Chitiniphilus sp. CD1]
MSLAFPVSTAVSSVEARRCRAITQIHRAQWEGSRQIQTPLRPEFLQVVEQSGINQLKHHYLDFLKEDTWLGCANIFISSTDFATFDSKLPAAARETIKRWYPDFMRFDVVECGYFTMIGEGLHVKDPADLAACLKSLHEEMDAIAQEQGAQFQMIRDVPYERFDEYMAVLRPAGFYPALGFPNSVLDISWKSIEEYLTALNAKTRLKFRNSMKFKEKFGIEVECTRDFAQHADRLATLWRNVNRNAKDYSRELLDEAFFRCCAQILDDRCEVLLFKYEGEVIAFMLNMIGEDDYIVLDWGVDYDFPHYKDANLYRAATVLSLQRAIELEKKRLELGITNYTPKMTLGATVAPLVYFVKNSENPRHSRSFARMLSDNIVQPDNAGHDALLRTGMQVADLPAIEARIKRAQDDYLDDDLFNRVGRYFRADSMRIGGIYGLYPEFNCAQESSITFTDQRKRVLLGTNSYLGAASHPSVVNAALRAIQRYGSGCSGSPLLNGTLDIHNLLEDELAAFLGCEAVALCSTGYQTNLAGLSALLQQGDVAIMDARNHRSLFDGVKLSGADCLIHRHADLDHMERLLQRTRGRRRMIVTDSLFSMEGTIADLRRICDLAETYGARVFVDESHAVGVLGETGRGVCELQGVSERVDVIMGTFSKSFAALGGFLAGREEVIDYIKHNAGGHIFSASLPPSVIETVRAVLELIRNEPERRAGILERARYMANALQEMGYNAPYYGSQIVPVIFGNYTLALAAYKRFMDHGVYVNPVGPPAVPEEASGFRTSYIATHSWDDLNRALEVFQKHRRDFGYGDR